jgi:hypothetical protein
MSKPEQINEPVWHCSGCKLPQLPSAAYTLGAYGDLYCDKCSQSMEFCARCGTPSRHDGDCHECGWDKRQSGHQRQRQVHEHNRRLMGGQSS